MSKYQFKLSSIYYPNSDIPINKFNIKDKDFLASIEQKLLEESYTKFISRLDKNTALNEDYFINLHKKTFESLYDFAGIYRDVNMSKGDSQFCLAKYLHSESKRIFSEIEKSEYLKSNNKQEFAKKIAYFQGELIALHPFYELNGRIIRMYCDMLSLYNGYGLIDYSCVSADLYIEASINAVKYADCSLLEEIIYKGLE